MLGNCLCGKISFEIDSEMINLYQCHCSLCRKQSGSSSNAATLIKSEEFRFLSGEEFIKSWVKDSGFRSDFCSVCGSPIPNPLGRTGFHWVPAGLLEHPTSPCKLILNLCVNSKASWTQLSPEIESYEQLPEFEYLINCLNVESSKT